MKTHASGKTAVTPARSRGTQPAFIAPAVEPATPFFTVRGGPVQTSLTVSQPGDPHEIEADRMADQVVAHREPAFFTPASDLQRQPDPAEEASAELDRAGEEELEKSPPVVRRSTGRISRHGTVARRPGNASVAPRPPRRPSISRLPARRTPPWRSGGQAARIDPSRARGPPLAGNRFESRLLATKGAGQPMAGRTRREMEASFGADFSGVRVHTGGEADQLSRSIQARAFTHGQDIYFSRNRYQPGDQAGRHLLAHELTHVVQQGSGIRETPRLRRSPDLSRAPPSLQRIPTSMEEVRQEVNAVAESIPGFSLGTVLIGHNPILGQDVAWSASAFFRGAAGLIPGGVAVYDKLNEGGAIDAAFAWIEGEIAGRNLTWGRVSGLWDVAWERMGVTEGISGNVEIFRSTFSGFFADVLGFIGAVVAKLTALLKDLAIAAVRELFGSDGPAYDMITMVLGQDPLTGEARTWETVEFLRAALTFFGFGNHVAKMDETGQLQNAANWLDQQFGLLASALGGLISGITGIWESLGLETLANPLDVLTRTVGVVTGFVSALLQFVGNLAIEILRLIKEVVISLAKQHVHRIPGYRLFTVVIGLDPVSGEEVPRTAMNFVRGFLDFVPDGDEIYRNLEEGNAIGKAMDWLGEQADELGLTPGAIAARFTELWTGFSIDDLMDPIGAFERVAGVFLGFVGDVLTLAGRIALKLLEILFETVMGGAGARVLAILKQAQGAFNTIVEDPVAFVGNLVAAARLGFTQFAGNILEHLRTGLLGWLFGALEGAGIQLPATFDLQGMLSLALQVLGLTYQQIRPQLVQHLGEPLVAHLETAFEVVRILLTEGLAGIWSRITEFLTVSLPEMVIGAIRNFVMERIVAAAVTRIATMLNPAGAVIQAILAIYNTIMFFIERMNQIMATVEVFVGSVSKIAAGDIGDAANAVEQTMARTLPVVLSFLARLIGLDGISERIREIIQRIQAPIQAAIGRVIGWIVAQARRLGRAVGIGRGAPPAAGAESEPETTGSAQVKQEAGRRFSQLITGETTLAEARTKAHQVEQELQPQGLRTLRIIPKPNEDGYKVMAEASPPDWLFDLTRPELTGSVGRGTATSAARTVVLGARIILDADPVSNAEPVTINNGQPVTMGSGPYRGAVLHQFRTDSLVEPGYGHARPGAIDPTSAPPLTPEERARANRGVSANYGRGAGSSVFGGFATQHNQPADTLLVRTWNTSVGATCQSNATHAEAMFARAMIGQDFYPRINAIELSLRDLGPCTLCAQTLGMFLSGLNARRASAAKPPVNASIEWAAPYNGNPSEGPACYGTSGMPPGWSGGGGPGSAPVPSPEIAPGTSTGPDGADSATSSQSGLRLQPPGQTKLKTGEEFDHDEREANQRARAFIESPHERDGAAGDPLQRCGGFFGRDFSRVRIHHDAPAAALCESLEARAFTRGADIRFNRGEFNPHTRPGRELLAHELSHVIQQGAAPPLAGSARSTRTPTAMKIRSHFRRSARRVSRRSTNEAPFFQNEAPEAAFFTPATDSKAKKPGEEPVKVAKEPEEEPVVSKKPEEEVAAKQEDEEVQAKQEDEESVMAKCGCGCCCGGRCRSGEPPEGARAKRPAARSETAASPAKDEPGSGGEQVIIAQARSRAKLLADRAVAQLTALMLMEDVAGAPPAALAVYERWFGGFDEGRVRFVRDRFLKIAEALAGTVEFDCDCDRPIYAFATPGGKRKVTLCKLFWSAGFSGLDSKAGVILHELAHDVCFALDLRYGAAKAGALAQTSPLLAMLNADNYEYFAESI